MHADFDLLADGQTRPSRGGAREGAGRKPGYSPNRAREMEAEGFDGDGNDVTATAVKKARAIARKEEALANQAELNFKRDSGEYLSRTAFREACATLLAQLAQGLRSLPDQIERKHSLPPEVITSVEVTIDTSLASLAAGLEMFTGADA